MNQAAARRAALREIAVLSGRADLDHIGVLQEAAALLAPAAPYDGWCGLTLDPSTLLMNGGVHDQGLDARTVPRLLELEYEAEDVNHFPDLARARAPAALLSTATAGRPETSARYRDVIRPSGFEQELRLVARSEGRAWGGFIFFREPGMLAYDAADLEFAGVAASLVGQALQAALRRAAPAVTDPPDERVMLLLGAANRIEGTSGPVAHILEKLEEVGPPDPTGLPYSVQLVANSCRQAVAQGRTSELSRTRVRTNNDGWLSLRATPFGEGAESKVLVEIEPSSALEAASIILDAYGLSDREGEVVRSLLHGFDTSQVAEALHISPFTVQDHLKSIFEKTGVRSRKDLVARLFSRHFLPGLTQGRRPGADGWFQ